MTEFGTIDIMLPVHNEAQSIQNTLLEFHKQALSDGIDIRFVICEDGSKDNTVEVIRNLQTTLPIVLITSGERKGYSRAVIDGLLATSSDFVGFIDSDGQCDPKDLKSFLKKMDSSQNCELVMGHRHPRNDHWIRLLMSIAFKLVYRLFFSVPVKDPSCPYLLIRRSALTRILSGKVGLLKQGFWWEFLARATSLQVRLVEIPVAHRQRLCGLTQIYRPTKVPRIAYEHLLGLITLKRELSLIKGPRLK